MADDLFDTPAPASTPTPPAEQQPVPLPMAPPRHPMDDSLALTADEQRFFSTGELPASLKPAPQPAPPPPIAPKPVAEPAPQPRNDKGQFAPASEQPAAPAPAAPDYAKLLADEMGRRAQVEAQFAQLSAKIEELSRPKPPPAPDVNVDPVGSITHSLKQIIDRLESQQAENAKAAQQRAEQDALNAFMGTIRNMRTEFVKQQPDFEAAYKHVRDLRADELRLLGATPQQADQILMQEELRLAEAEIRMGRNPVAQMYERAKRYGYAAPTAPAAPAAGPSPTDKIAAMKAAVEAAAKGVDRGAQLAEPPTLATLRDASEAQLDKLVRDSAAWDTILGSGPKTLF